MGKIELINLKYLFKSISLSSFNKEEIPKIIAVDGINKIPISAFKEEKMA